VGVALHQHCQVFSLTLPAMPAAPLIAALTAISGVSALNYAVVSKYGEMLIYILYTSTLKN